MCLQFKQQADNTLRPMKLKHGFGLAGSHPAHNERNKREVFGLKVNSRRNGTFLFIFFEAINTLVVILFVPFDVDLTCI